MPLTTPGTAIEVHLGPDEWERSLRADALRRAYRHPQGPAADVALRRARLRRSSTQITRLPEYYPTRAERSILHARRGRDRRDARRRHARRARLRHVGEDARCCSTPSPIAGPLQRYVPFDVAEATLRDAADASPREYPGVAVHGVVGDFRRHLDAAPARRATADRVPRRHDRQPRPARARATSSRAVADEMAPGDSFLLGTDLVKDRDRLVARLRRRRRRHRRVQQNVLRVLNRELDADFDLDGSTTSLASTRTTSGSRCGCGRAARSRSRRGARPRR